MIRWKPRKKLREGKETLANKINEGISRAISADLPSETEARVKRRIEAVLAEELGRLLEQAEGDKKAKEGAGKVEAEETFQRFNLHFRVQHMIMITSVILLIVTGLPLKFPEGPLGGLVWLLGGLDVTRTLHRIGGTSLVVVSIYHTAYTILHPDGRRDFLLLLPRFQDLRDLVQNIRFNLGLASSRPRFDRFSYIEKFDYWAVYWGCVIMIGSGALLWFETMSLTYLPKFVLDIAKEAHSDEALLATLAIVIWHFYHVHLNPDKFPGTATWWTGKISKREMMEEHPLEYERIMARERGGFGASDNPGSAPVAVSGG